MRKNCIQFSLIRESHFSGSSSLFPQKNLQFRKFVTSNKKLYTISCKFPLAFSRGFYLIRPCAAYPWPFPADSASSCRPPLGFRSKKPVTRAALWPTDDRLFPRNAPETTVSLYSSCCFRICWHPLSSFSFQKKRVPFHLFLRALNRPLPFRSHGAGQKSLPLLALGTSSSSGISAASSARRHSRFSRGSS